MSASPSARGQWKFLILFRDGITRHDRRSLSPTPGEPPSGELQPDQHQAVRKAPLGFVVGRLLDAFDKHASGVSALQYSRNIRMARRRGAWGSAPGTTTGRSLGQSAPAA